MTICMAEDLTTPAQMCACRPLPGQNGSGVGGANGELPDYGVLLTVAYETAGATQDDDTQVRGRTS